MKVFLITVSAFVFAILLITSVALGAQYLQVPTISRIPFSAFVDVSQEQAPISIEKFKVYSPVQPIFLPMISGKVESLQWIDPTNRQESLDFFNQVYLASEGVDSGWTGDYENCDAGQTSEEFKQAVERRINYFRSMAGVPGTIQLDDTYNSKAQQAACMMSVNKKLSHNPPPTWECYTAGGAEAAGKSNLALGAYGPEAITLFMFDPGSGNYFVGHRRWILYPQTQSMGTGDIPPEGNYWSANALWVFDQNVWGPRPETREAYIPWPPAGYVPYQVVFPRWSFSYDDADLSDATVEMSSGGQHIQLIVNTVQNGYGENTLVWEPALFFGGPPPSDIAYDVTVSGVMIGGVPHEFSYQVIVFDPGSLNGTPARQPSGKLNEAVPSPSKR